MCSFSLVMAVINQLWRRFAGVSIRILSVCMLLGFSLCSPFPATTNSYTFLLVHTIMVAFIQIIIHEIRRHIAKLKMCIYVCSYCSVVQCSPSLRSLYIVYTCSTCTSCWCLRVVQIMWLSHGSININMRHFCLAIPGMRVTHFSIYETYVHTANGTISKPLLSSCVFRCRNI